MQREDMLKRLALVRQDVARTEDSIAYQLDMIAGLERDGGNPAVAQRLLARFRHHYHLTLQKRDRLVQRVAESINSFGL